jgi:hypothetical protein
MFIDTIDAAFEYWARSSRVSNSIGAFFLFTLNDEQFPTFVDQNGMADLQLWAANKCMFLVFHSPSREYIESVLRDPTEPWFDILRDMGLSAFVDEPVVAINEDLPNTIRDLFTSCRNPYSRNKQILSVLTRWGRAPDDCPCLIFFRDLAEGTGWHQDLKIMQGLELHELRNSLRNYFSGTIYKNMYAQLQNRKRG